MRRRRHGGIGWPFGVVVEGVEGSARRSEGVQSVRTGVGGERVQGLRRGGRARRDERGCVSVRVCASVVVRVCSRVDGMAARLGEQSDTRSGDQGDRARRRPLALAPTTRSHARTHRSRLAVDGLLYCSYTQLPARLAPAAPGVLFVAPGTRSSRSSTGPLRSLQVTRAGGMRAGDMLKGVVVLQTSGAPLCAPWTAPEASRHLWQPVALTEQLIDGEQGPIWVHWVWCTCPDWLPSPLRFARGPSSPRALLQLARIASYCGATDDCLLLPRQLQQPHDAPLRAF